MLQTAAEKTGKKETKRVAFETFRLTGKERITSNLDRL